MPQEDAGTAAGDSGIEVNSNEDEVDELHVKWLSSVQR